MHLRDSLNAKLSGSLGLEKGRKRGVFLPREKGLADMGAFAQGAVYGMDGHTEEGHTEFQVDWCRFCLPRRP